MGHLDSPGDSPILSPLTTASLPSPHWSLAINSQAPAIRKMASWGLALLTTGVTGHSLTQPLLCSGRARIDRWAEGGLHLLQAATTHPHSHCHPSCSLQASVPAPGPTQTLVRMLGRWGQEPPLSHALHDLCKVHMATTILSCLPLHRRLHMSSPPSAWISPPTTSFSSTPCTPPALSLPQTHQTRHQDIPHALPSTFLVQISTLF